MSSSPSDFSSAYKYIMRKIIKNCELELSSREKKKTTKTFK